MAFFRKKSDEQGDEKPRFSVVKPEIPELPGLAEGIDVKYPLIPPYVYAHVFWDKEQKEFVYFIEEPKLNPEEKKILELVEQGIKELINISFIGTKEGETIIKYLEKNIDILLAELGVKITEESYLKLMYYIYRDFVGLNEIEPLLWDYFIEDIECNGTNSPLYIVHRKYRNLRTNITYTSMERLANFVEKLAQKCGKYISYATPLLDGSLPDGSRVQATYATDIASRGPTFTIRKFTKEPWAPTMLIQLGSVSPEILAYLWILIEYGGNVMVIGGTASGKTTMLNALSFFIPPQARIVSIEDTRELNLLHENWLPSVARSGVGQMTLTGKEYGEVSLFDLLKESFRQRPDYVIVGEVRGAEAYVLFQGMSAGHPSFGTMHAEDVETMTRRLESPPINLSPALLNSLDAVCIVAQVKVGGKVFRKITEVVEIVDVKELGKVVKNSPFVWDPKTNRFFFKTESFVFNKLIAKHGLRREDLLTEFQRRTKLLTAMYRNKIFGFKEVQDVINAYYKDPQKALRQFGAG